MNAYVVFAISWFAASWLMVRITYDFFYTLAFSTILGGLLTAAVMSVLG